MTGAYVMMGVLTILGLAVAAYVAGDLSRKGALIIAALGLVPLLVGTVLWVVGI